MNCAEFEALFCDYGDGTLSSGERALVEAHLAGCPACAELARDIASALGFLETVARVEPPPELLTRILHQIPAGKAASSGRPSWWSRVFGSAMGGLFESVLQPRYVMGVAMTVLSFSMVARFAGIQPRQLRPADLDPVKIWVSVDDRAHRVWDRGVKYYDNLRWVIQVEARLQEWSDQERETERTQAKGKPKAEGSPKHQ